MTDRPPRHPDLAALRQFRFLDDIDDGRLGLLGKSLQIQVGRKREYLFRRGDTQDFSLLLLRGDLLLDDGAAERFRISAGNELASGPIAPVLPRRYDAVCLREVRYLALDNEVLRDLRASAPGPDPSAPRLAAPDKGDAVEQLVAVIGRDIDEQRLRLPSLPEVALRIGRAMDEEASDARRVAGILQTDPAITAKLVRVANSAYYATPAPARTCAEAVLRLGFRTTYRLVLSMALREVFHTRSRSLGQRMRGLWQHSVEVAALCYALARQARGFNPDEALLAGLVHDIGLIPLIDYAARSGELAQDPEILEGLMRALRGELGALILERWRFSGSLVMCAREAEDWLRDPAPSADYCDLVVIAHALRPAPEQAPGIPVLESLPAYGKLGLDADAATSPVTLLERMAESLAFAEALLTA
jgi:HD-like signal output (HDOD) protein